MKKIFINLTIFLGVSFLFADSIGLDVVKSIAESKIRHDNKTNYSIKKINIFQIDSNISAYIFQLNPQGFIVTSANEDITPIIGYSYKSNFSLEENTANIALEMIRTDLKLRTNAISYTDPTLLKENNALWKNYADKNYILQNTKDEIWPPEGYSISEGWVEVLWDIYFPYWNFCPLDPETGQRSNTSCMTTAITQIMQYHHFIGEPSFTDSDDYYSTYTNPSIHIDDECNQYDFPSFPELNVFVDDLKDNLESYAPLTNDDKAAISFAFGVAAKVDYCSSHGSGATPLNAKNALLTKFGYDSANLVNNTNSTFYDDLISNMMDAKPALLGIFQSDTQVGHAIVCDGYNASDNTYHLNFGWSGSCNGWYSLPCGMPADYDIVSLAIMDIEGGSIPFHIDGQIIEDSAPVENTSVTLQGPRNYHCIVGNTDGHFSIEYVVEGDYIVTALIELPGGGYYYKTQEMYLDPINNGILLFLDSYKTIAAHVNAPVNPEGCNVAMYKNELIVTSGETNSDGNVRMKGVLPDIYSVSASLQSNYFVISEFEVTAENQYIILNLTEYPYDSTINYAGDPVGQLQLLENMSCGIKLAGEDIADFGNDVINGINFIAPFNPDDGQIFGQVWHDNTLLSEKEINDFFEGQWTSIVLDNFVAINPEKVYYVGYRIHSLSGSVSAAYHDAGPRIEEKGAFIKTGSWMQLPYTYDFNFCINANIISQNPVYSEENVIPNNESNLTNYPNPFNPTTKISFSILEDSKVELNIYNCRGQRVKTLIDSNLNSGNHTILWDGKDFKNIEMSSGIYFYKLIIDKKPDSIKKCILLK